MRSKIGQNNKADRLYYYSNRSFNNYSLYTDGFPWACKDKKLVSLKIPTDPSCIWSTDSKQCLDKSDSGGK